MSSLQQGREFFAGDDLGLAVFDRVAAWIDVCGGAELRVANTQVGWARQRGFAFLWSPQRWLGDRAAPLVLTIALRSQDTSGRWKEVVEIRPGLYNHHLEVHSVDEADAEVFAWVGRAYDEAAT